MTVSEAWVYLNGTPGDELDEAYELQLFEHKQFFLSKTVLPPLFLKRLEKIDLLNEAFFALGGNFSQKWTLFQIQFTPSNLLLETYLGYQSERNKLRLAINQCESGEELHHLINQCIQLESIYISKWENSMEKDESIILSKETDSMELLKEMRGYALRGGFSFDDLKKNVNNPPEILYNEMKRLSLLFKKYTWTKI